MGHFVAPPLIVHPTLWLDLQEPVLNCGNTAQIFPDMLLSYIADWKWGSLAVHNGDAKDLLCQDPPFGLPKFFDDPRKELSFSGVFRVSPEGKQVQLLTTNLKGPNGLAFSPDEKYFYVDNWDAKKKVILRYEVNPDGTLSNGKVFFDMTSVPEKDALDGMKIDEKGNLYVSGPGGLWIISSDGKHLGTIIGPEHPHNMAWGDDDGKTLYLCAQTGLYRIRLNVPGIRPPFAQKELAKR